MKRIAIALLAVVVGATACAAMGKKPLMENRLQLAEEIKLADRVTGIERAVANLSLKADGQAAAVAGLNNTISKVQQSAGRDIIYSNDAAIFKGQAELAKYQAKLWKDMFRYCMGIMSTIVLLLVRQVFAFFNKYMFYKEQTFLRIEDEAEMTHVKDLQAKGKLTARIVAAAKSMGGRK